VVDPTLLRPSDVTLQIPDISKFQEATGWQPEISTKKTLQDLLTYHRERIKEVKVRL
jgi:GDPmannose 4,6-dehydratase/GDP-4-dehydro-6-deoxy-D-mannose reductase